MAGINRVLFIDIETYSSLNISDCGAYKYIESPDLEILIVGYASDDKEVKIAITKYSTRSGKLPMNKKRILAKKHKI